MVNNYLHVSMRWLDARLEYIYLHRLTSVIISSIGKSFLYYYKLNYEAIDFTHFSADAYPAAPISCADCC